MSAAAIRFQRTTTLAAQAAARGLNLPALIGGFGVAAFGSKIREAIGNIGDLADAAARAGVSAEKLQVLRYALSQNGGEASKADEALRGLSVRLGDLANTGAGSAAPAMKALGLTFAQLAGLSADQRFDVIAAKLAAVADPARRAGLAAKLFGDEAGPQLAALLGQGNSVIADTEARMRALGTLMSNETVAAGDALDDKFQEWSTVIDTTFKRSVVGAADAIYDLIDSFRALRNQTSLRNLSAELDAIAAKRDALNETIAAITADNPPGAIIGPGKALVESQLKDLRGQIEALDHQANAVLSRIGDLNSEAKAQRPALGLGSGVISTAPPPPKTVVDKAQAKELDAVAEAAAGVVRQYGTWSQVAHLATDEQKKLAAAVAKGTITAQQAAFAYADFLGQFGQFQWIDQVGDAFNNLASSAVTDFSSMGDAAVSFLKQLVNIAGQTLVITPLINNLKAAMSSAASGGGGIAGFISSLFGGGGGGSGLTLGSLYHEGGTVGAGGKSRAVSASAFFGAPRYHAGKLGLQAGEIPSILKTGETVLTEATAGRVASTMGGLAAAAANGGGRNVEVNVNVKGGEAQVKQRKNSSGGVDIDVLIGNAIATDIAKGGVASRMIEQTFGLNRANGMRG
jgi:hypothetical protein